MTEEPTEEDVLHYATSLIDVPSPLGEPVEVANKLASMMREFSTDVRIDKDSNVICRIRASRNGNRILIATHTDTITSPSGKEKPFWKLSDGVPFGKTGKVLVGPGAAAPKGELSSMLAAVRALAKHKESFAGELVFAAYADDMRSDLKTLTSLLSGLRADRATIDLMLQGEPSDNMVVMGTRGKMEVELVVEAVRTDEDDPEEGVAVIEEMSKILVAIKSLKLPVHPYLGPATMTTIAVSSEPGPRGIPTKCKAVLDRRILPGEDADAIIDEMQVVMQRSASNNDRVRTNLLVKLLHDPFEVSPSDLAVITVLQIVKEVTDKREPGTYPSFTTNAGYTRTKFGIPCISIGPGRVEDISSDHVEVQKLVEAAQIYYRAIQALGALPIGESRRGQS